MVFVLFLVLSLILLGIAFSMIHFNRRLKNEGITAVGKVIRNEKYIESTFDQFNQLINITLYRPIIEFKTKDGLILQGICEQGSNPPEFDEGDEISIIYPSNEPEDFVLKSSIESMELPITLIIISIMMLVFACILLFI